MNRTDYNSVKRLLDVILSAAGIIVTLPIWLIAIAGIELSDPGPLFYGARRIGRNNKVFLMFKFRSMKTDRNADERYFKADEDRIFKFGKFIRRLKIDELPQLINVLHGEMSIVGPRPAAIDQAEVVRAGENAVVANVKPGLTGPSALYDYIYGDSVKDEAEYKEKVLPVRLALDVYYVNHQDLLYDARMILYTVICIFRTLENKTPDRILHELVHYTR